MSVQRLTGRAGPLLLALLGVSFLGTAACHGNQPGSQAPVTTPAPKTFGDYFNIAVDGHALHMQLAVYEAEQERGLMERRDLGPDDGMIFVCEAPKQQTFWMHDTPTPLDIGFFTASGELAEVYPLLPFDERIVASIGKDLQYAVETNKGWYARHGVAPGARIDMAALAAALRARGFDPAKFGIGAP